jgi:hypothetical protein
MPNLSQPQYLLFGDPTENEARIKELHKNVRMQVSAPQGATAVAVRRHFGSRSPYRIRALFDITLSAFWNEEGFHFSGSLKCRVATPVEVIEVSIVDVCAATVPDAETALVRAIYEQLEVEYYKLHPPVP